MKIILIKFIYPGMFIYQTDDKVYKWRMNRGSLVNFIKKEYDLDFDLPSDIKWFTQQEFNIYRDALMRIGYLIHSELNKLKKEN